VSVPVAIVAIELLGGYGSIERLSRTRAIALAFAGPIAGLSALTLVMYAMHSAPLSRVLVFTYIFFSVIAILAYRTALLTYKTRRLAAGRYARATAFVGHPEDISRLLATQPSLDSERYFRPVGFFDIPDVRPSSTCPVTRVGSVEEVSATLVHTSVDLMIVVLPDRPVSWLSGLLQACDYFRVTVQLVPAPLVDLTTGLRDLRVPPAAGPFRIPAVLLEPRNLDATALFFKRLIDVFVSAVLLVLLSPLFLVIAIAIKLTTPKSTILHRWKVIGYQGRPFTGYKFTTMVSDAEARRAELVHLNEMTGPVFKIRNDPRVTPLGRILRKFSLNELPQLWSVLKGDMSLVGPRPVFPHELAGYELWHKRKLSVRPGITCLWQVMGRNRINSFDEWVRLDLEYIDDWSLWLDFRILVRTLWTVVVGSGS